MTASPTNPFVLPGFGQTGDSATNPLLASMEMMRQAFAGLGGVFLFLTNYVFSLLMSKVLQNKPTTHA